MNIVFTAHAWEDFGYWIDTDTETAQKIRDLIDSIRQDPFKGEGKPEPLKANLRPYWSRRISQEHRLVYAVSGTKGVDQKVTIIQCRFHY
jgi:toxin YoeB